MDDHDILSVSALQLPLDLPVERENLPQILATLVEKYPNEVASALLDTYWWPEHLKTMTGYRHSRYEDDSKFGSITVTISNDSDTWIEILSDHDPNELNVSMRFRMPLIGGGDSPRVRNALLILAEAIRLDNMDRPQYRGEPPT